MIFTRRRGIEHNKPFIITHSETAGPSSRDTESRASAAQELPKALTIVSPHMGAGGMQRVLATLANAWACKGYHITIVTLHADEVLYTLDRRVNLLSLPNWDGAGIWLKAIDGPWAAMLPYT